jgi:hypothetical protein
MQHHVALLPKLGTQARNTSRSSRRGPAAALPVAYCFGAVLLQMHRPRSVIAGVWHIMPCSPSPFDHPRHLPRLAEHRLQDTASCHLGHVGHLNHVNCQGPARAPRHQQQLRLAAQARPQVILAGDAAGRCVGHPGSRRNGCKQTCMNGTQSRQRCSECFQQAGARVAYLCQHLKRYNCACMPSACQGLPSVL